MLLALAVALIGFGWIKGAQSAERKHDAYVAKEAQEQITGLKAAAVHTAQWAKGKDDALAAASIRARANALVAAGLRADVDGLRDDLGLDASKLPGASVASIRRYTATLQRVFGECSRSYEALASRAAGHASDALKLEQAWPH